MASQFQNRLVGISILVASVVIFLPTIIDGKKNAYEDEFVAIPLNPEFKEHTQALNSVKQEKSVHQDEQWQVEEVAQDALVLQEDNLSVQTEDNATSSKQSEKSKTKAPESAWTIQLGAFQNAENINSLLKKLHKAGFQAHTVPMEVIDGKLTRLFVGPNVSKSKLEKQLPRLKRLTNLDGKLLPFDAVNP